MERHGLTSFCRRVSHKKTAVLKSVVSKPPFGVRFRLGRVNRTAAHPTVFLYAVSVGGWGCRYILLTLIFIVHIPHEVFSKPLYVSNDRSGDQHVLI